jgi:hypothetical protein
MKWIKILHCCHFLQFQNVGGNYKWLEEYMSSLYFDLSLGLLKKKATLHMPPMHYGLEKLHLHTGVVVVRLSLCLVTKTLWCFTMACIVWNFIFKWSCSAFTSCWKHCAAAQALVSFKKYMPPPLPYFTVNICPFSLPYFASIFFAYLWSFCWPNYIVTLPRYFSFRLPHLNIPTGPPSDELDKNIQRTSLGLLFSHWNGYSHFWFVLDFSYAFLNRHLIVPLF